MICRFCDQWNPQGAVRCSFCGNPPGAETDATDAAPRPYGATLPPAAPPAVALPKREPALTGSARRREPGEGNAMTVALTCAVVGGLMLLVLVIRCVF